MNSRFSQVDTVYPSSYQQNHCPSGEVSSCSWSRYPLCLCKKWEASIKNIIRKNKNCQATRLLKLLIKQNFYDAILFLGKKKGKYQQSKLIAEIPKQTEHNKPIATIANYKTQTGKFLIPSFFCLSLPKGSGSGFLINLMIPFQCSKELC